MQNTQNTQNTTHNTTHNITTIPNHFWCVYCSSQYPLTQKYPCTNYSCNANYCKNCVLDFHAKYFNIPKPTGELPYALSSATNYLRQPRCRYCNIIIGTQFFKKTNILPLSSQNVLTLKRERDGIRVNYLQDSCRATTQS